MNKKIAVILITCMLIAIATVFSYKYLSVENKEGQSEKQDTSDTIDPSKLVQKIFDVAQLGQTPYVPFENGATLDDVIEQLGEPESVTSTSVGDYADFPSKQISVGMENGQLFDIRSYHHELANIRLNDIKQFAGEPDQITYYQDSQTNQIILTYEVNTAYHLKWIVDRPTEENQNPTVHHTSLLTTTAVKSQELAKIISNMTLDEKIGQMIFAGISGPTLSPADYKLLEQHKVGGLIFFKKDLTSSNQILQLLNDIKSINSKNDFPLFLGIDEEGGRISRLPNEFISLPSSQVIGKSNVSFAYEIGTILGKELSNFGFNLNFAPVLDVNSNPNNPVIGDRSFGNNPELVSSYGIETMKGMQSQNVIPVVKHFPGHGDTSVDSHLDLPIVNKSKEQLDALELIPFKEAIKYGTDVVMIAHILLPEIDPQYPASMSAEIITNILRSEMGYDGVVITDDMTMKAVTNNYSLSYAAVQSIKAGSDIVLIAHHYDDVSSTINALKQAVQKGEITENRIDESVKRILLLKETYKLDNSKIDTINVHEINSTIQKMLEKYNS
ncbi:beta-N-acetylhexosaminidase [Lysinibacillus antri]|nr:beta-N-acetylhexosaminidase [Lysinibacillus antri]